MRDLYVSRWCQQRRALPVVARSTGHLIVEPRQSQRVESVLYSFKEHFDIGVQRLDRRIVGERRTSRGHEFGRMQHELRVREPLLDNAVGHAEEEPSVAPCRTQ